ncbi:hypothetical protein [Mesobacillus zeae]|uniref:hypothetical protein n=1 Tax=Mesobacillus zeae TaxID=1917180 RepID=UPI0030097891
MRNTTVEIELLRGDNVILLKTLYDKVILQSPTQKEVDAVINRYIEYAEENHLI